MFVRNPAELIFRILSEMGHVLQAADQKTMEEQKTHVAAWAESFIKNLREHACGGFHLMASTFLFSCLVLGAVCSCFRRIAQFQAGSFWALSGE